MGEHSTGWAAAYLFSRRVAAPPQLQPSERASDVWLCNLVAMGSGQLDRVERDGRISGFWGIGNASEEFGGHCLLTLADTSSPFNTGLPVH
jgi:hypothetical protein